MVSIVRFQPISQANHTNGRIIYSQWNAEESFYRRVPARLADPLGIEHGII